MQPKVLSYCLFEPLTLPQHRHWDKWKNDGSRYWFNLPAVALANKILFPDYTMLLHVSKNVWENELSLVIKILGENIDTFEVRTIERDYNLTEPALWRMIPLWDRDVETFHTRDLDSLPNEDEYRFVRAFEASDCSIGTIRTHENHYGVKCRMLAGLSSFKTQQIPWNIKLDKFDTFYAMRHNAYGSDQDLMIKFFTNNRDFTGKSFFDYATHNQKNPQDFPCIRAKDEQMKLIEVDEAKREVLSKVEKIFGNTWCGEPIDARGEFTTYILDKFPLIATELKTHSFLKNFYGVK